MIWLLAVFCVPALLLFMLVPTFIELRRPSDAGPRAILPNLTPIVPTPLSKPKCLLDLEEPHQLDITLKPFLEVIFSSWTNRELET